MSELLKHDDLYAIRNYPGHYAGRVVFSVGEFPRPATDNHFVVANLDRIAAPGELYNVLLYGRFLDYVVSWFGAKPESGLYVWVFKLGLFVILIIGFVIGSGVGVLVDGVRRRSVTNKEFVYLYVSMTLFYIAVISRLLVSFENNRNRVMIEPLLVVYVASRIKDYLDERPSRRREPA